jgi:thiamine transport system substrate-binding protein
MSSSRTSRRTRYIALVAAGAVLAGACGSAERAERADPTTLVLLTYESFTPSPTAFDAFTEATGITVDIARSGDAGELVSKAVLTAGNPEGDVLWGVDNTLLSRVLEAEVFVPYAADGLSQIPPRLTALVPGHQLTPVDEGDVCINYDVAALGDRGLPPPTDLASLLAPGYRDLLVVPNPATSSPGLAFMLATIAEFGTEGWLDYWGQLRASGVRVVDGWNEAYYGEFTRSGGSRPLVVSYGTSPPAEVVFAEPPLPPGAPSPTGVAAATCFQQVEFAGILRGSTKVEAAQQLIEYLIDTPFQEDLPLQLFVHPANQAAALPEVFVAHAVRPEDPLTLDPEDIAANRTTWIDQWTTVVLR